jgi:hypothetical protein
MSIFLNENCEDLTEEEGQLFLQLAKKFYKARRASVVELVGKDTDQIAWVEGFFADAGDGIDAIRIAMSTREDFLEMIAELDEGDTLEFEHDEQFI